MAIANNEAPRFDFMTKKPLWFGISAVLLAPGIIAMILCFMQFGSPVRLGIDFTGGSLIQATFTKPVSSDQVQAVLKKQGVEDAHVQIADEKTALVRARAMKSEEYAKLKTALASEVGPYTGDRFESVGPTIGKELLTNSLLAVGITFLGIIGYISYRFQFDFAACAIVALVHDAIFLVGLFALLGLTIGVEVDALFMTALLTVIGFSVHDTIIIYDRIRENMHHAGKRDTFDDVANRSIWQTLARSINTSVTVMLPLLAMLIFGGESIRWFVFAMLVGIGAGAYSSIFNASQLLSVWRMMGVKRA